MEKVWSMRDGREIKVADMDTNHIKNALVMVRNKGAISPSELSFALSCPMPNGDMACMAVEREQDRMFGAPICTAIDWFEEELKIRGEKIP